MKKPLRIQELEKRYDIRLKELKAFDLKNSIHDKAYVLDEKGDVIWLNLDGCHIDNLSGLKGFTSLRYLSVVGNNIQKLQGLDQFSELEVLYVWNNPTAKIEGLNNLHKLKMLRAGSTKTTKIEGLDALTGLLELSIDCTNISTIEGLEKLTNLKVLRFIRSKITSIQGLDALTQLEELDLQYAKVGKLENLGNLTSLKVLKVSGGIKKIENLDRLTSLEELVLTFNKISKIENLNNQQQLQKLSLNHNEISIVENVDHLAALKTLDLSNNRLEQFSGFENSVQLEKIDLSRNKLKSMNGFERFENLKLLNLSGNEIRKRIKLPRESSMYIDLSGNPMQIKLKQYKQKDITLEFLISNLYNLRGFDVTGEKDFYEILSGYGLNYEIEAYTVYKAKVNDSLSFKIEFYPDEVVYYLNDQDVAVQSGHFELWFLRWKELLKIAVSAKKQETAYFLLLLPIVAIEPDECAEALTEISRHIEKLELAPKAIAHLANCIVEGVSVPANTFVYNKNAGITDSMYNHSNRKYDLYNDECKSAYVELIKTLESL